MAAVAALFVGVAVGQAPAFCPVSELTKCAHTKCSPKIWHGIDSLEQFEVAAINDSAVSIRSLSTPPSFEDTVGIVTIHGLDDQPVDPRYCVRAPPLPTGEGNCTTRLHAFFSDANATLETLVMDSCGILSWKSPLGAVGHLYGQWAHANEPHPAPKGGMCDWQPGLSLYEEVGSSPPKYFTLESVREKGVINQTAVRIHSVNGSFPDTTATVFETIGGGGGKIAWRAELFGGKLYRGIMRANSAGGVACCEVETDKSGVVGLKRCPVVSWWSADGSYSCWAPVQVPWSGYETECNE